MIDQQFWKGKKVLITGNTGFKGSWLSMWLTQLGAQVTGYSLKPPTSPSLFELANLHSLYKTHFADIRDRETLRLVVQQAKPEIVFHMAAQPLVRASYKNPVETYETNVMGTVYLLEALRENNATTKALINITTDKCYQNNEWLWGYRENEPLGGHDPYSSSKACSELVTASYRSSFYSEETSRMNIASARAGNVIGGGDWAEDRLIPDCLRQLWNDELITIRNPEAIRPWQHVLEPLSGYILLAQKLFEVGQSYAEAWNFGPDDSDARPVKWIVEHLIQRWAGSQGYQLEESQQPHEANYLKLDCSKAKTHLNWAPRWSLETAIEKIVDWSQRYQKGESVFDICIRQIEEYQNQTN